MIRFGFITSLCLVGIGTGLCPPVSAQALFSQANRESDNVILLAPRPLIRLLREGERAIAEGRYIDGVKALGALLQDDTEELPEDLRGQDFFLEPDVRGLFSKTIKGDALRILADLPREGRKVLEIEFGVTATQKLAEAVSARDFSAIADVARRYPHTNSGYDAQIYVARQKLSLGYPMAAASIYQSLLDYPGARERYGIELAKAAAVSWMLAGMEDEAAETLKLAVEDFPGASIELDGRQLPIDRSADWKSLLQQSSLADHSSNGYPPAENWLVAGGSPSRNAVVEASMPLSAARWVTEIHGSVPEKDAIQSLAETERQGDRVILPQFETRMLGDLILTKTTDSEVLAIDFETGLTKWPFYHNSLAVKLNNFQFENAMGGGRAELSDQLQTRVWGSAAFGRFSCDTERLYYVSEESENARAQAIGQRVGNLLQGVSIAGQGKILWRVGGENDASTSEPGLEGAFFLGPPLAYEGELYVLIERSGETRLAALEPETGKLLWSQQLVHPIYRPLAFDPERRSQALSPTISDGVILCPTGAGAVVAVDLLTRSLRWAVAYNAQSTSSRAPFRGGAFGSFNGVDFNPLAPRWQDTGMIVQDGIVAISPIESDTFFCRKILTGESVLSPQRRNGGRYVAGIRDGHIIVVAERSIYSINLVEKKLAWEVDFPDRSKLAGKGLWMADSMMIPLTGNRLLEYSTATGEILAEATVDQPLGNLFAHRGNLISASPTSVAVFYTQRDLQERVEQRLAVNPQDTWALNQSAQLAFAAGELEQAYALLNESYRIEPTSVDTQYLLVETLLAGLEKNFKAYEGRARDLQRIVEYGPQRFRFLQWLAVGNIREQKYIAAFDSLIELMRERVGTSYAGSMSRARELRIDENYSVDTDIWIATELARIYTKATEAERKEMDRRVQEELALMSDVVIPLRRQKLKYFAWHPSAERQMVATAIAMLEREDQTESEQLLQPLLYSQSAETREIASKLLSRRHVKDNAWFGPRGRAFDSIYNRQLEAIAGEPEVEEGLMTPIEWNAGQFNINEVLYEQRLYPNGYRLQQTSERYGRPDLDIRLLGSSVVVCNTNGEDVAHFDYDRASADISDEFTRATVRGGLLIIETSSEVVGMDLYRGLESRRDALIWRQSLLYPNASPNAQFSPPKTPNIENNALGVLIPQRLVGGQKTMVGPLTAAGLVLQLATSVVSIDAYTGRQQWSRDGYDGRIRFASDGTKLAIVNPSLGRVEIVDCRDGALLDTYKYEGDWQPWFSHGRMVVDYDQIQTNSSNGILSARTMRPILRVWDAVSGDEVALLDLKRGARADVCEGRYLVVLEPDSKLHFFDLETGAYSKHETQAEDNLENIFVERFGQTLVVCCNSESLERQGGINNFANRMGDYRLVNGSVYGFDLDQQELIWNRPGRLLGMNFPATQPRNSPFMVTYQVKQRSATTLEASVAVVDLRSGRLSYASRNQTMKSATGFAMLLRPRLQRVEVSMGGTHFVFTATKEERPPQPVFDFGISFDNAENRRPRQGIDFFK